MLDPYTIKKMLEQKNTDAAAEAMADECARIQEELLDVLNKKAAETPTFIILSVLLALAAGYTDVLEEEQGPEGAGTAVFAEKLFNQILNNRSRSRI